MMKDLDEIARLRLERARIHEVCEHNRLRLKYGEKYVRAINDSVGCSLSINDFNAQAIEPIQLTWPKDLSQSDGLVEAYISKSKVDSILKCISESLGVLSGSIGFLGKGYLGLSEIENVDPIKLLAIASSLNESVIFYNDRPSGVLLVDCYVSQPSEPFTIVVRGESMVQRLNSCFSN